MRKMLINAPARDDLDSIDHYLRVEKCNPQAADELDVLEVVGRRTGADILGGFV